MRIVLGRGNRRQTWEITPKNYSDNRKDAEALLIYVGLIR